MDAQSQEPSATGAAQDADAKDESISSGGGGQRNTYKQKYKRAWELDKELRDWLTACTSDAYAAYCRFCRAKLHAHKKGLLAHAKSAKHRKHINNPNLAPDHHLALVRASVDPQPPAMNGAVVSAEMTPKRGGRHFNDNWLKEPSFSPWVRKVPSDPTKALCVACKCIIVAGRSELMKHTKAAKHKRAIKDGPFEEISEDELFKVQQSIFNIAIPTQGSLPPFTARSKTNMTTLSQAPGVLLDDAIKKIQTLCPPSLAESWDNTGVILKPPQVRSTSAVGGIVMPESVVIKHIMLTIDLSEAVASEAVDTACQMIISYHPPIFGAVKRFDADANWKDRAMFTLLRNNITVYSPHTALDVVPNGMNDWLASLFEPREIACKLPAQEKTNPIPDKIQSPIGLGRICHLASPVTIANVISRVKQHLKLSSLRLALAPCHDQQSSIKSFAVCAGSGGSVLKGCGAQLFITGEMSHHDILDAIHHDSSVILVEHTNAERGFLQHWKSTLSEILQNKVHISISETDEDPVQIC